MTTPSPQKSGDFLEVQNRATWGTYKFHKFICTLSRLGVHKLDISYKGYKSTSSKTVIVGCKDIPPRGVPGPILWEKREMFPALF